MSINFVIVVEVDNKRAHAAYLKGLADLDVIWPQVAAFTKDRNDKIEEAQRKRLAQFEAEVSALSALTQEWNRAKRAHDEWLAKSPFFRGPEPAIPSYPRTLFSPTLNLDSLGTYRGTYDSEKRELQNMANLAGAAIGPYRMTEHQVKEMIKWEDGSRIDQIKAHIRGDA